MHDIQLGQKITTDQERDAIHIAVIPLVAAGEFLPGQPFRLAYTDNTKAVPVTTADSTDCIGIIDPFLDENEYIGEGDRVWGVLFPNTVTGMRHHWEHPAFSETESVIETVNNDEEEEEESNQLTRQEHWDWIRDFADRWRFDLDELVSNAKSFNAWRYATARGRDLHSAGELEEDHDLFWYHLEGYTGQQFSPEHRGSMGWSCSC